MAGSQSSRLVDLCERVAKEIRAISTAVKLRLTQTEADTRYLGKSATASSASKIATSRNISLSGGVVGTATAFDGSKDISVPVTEIKEAYLTWGGKNFSQSYGPIDAAMVPELGANRFAFGKAAGVTVEYSRDAGATWADYGATGAQKAALFSTGCGFTIGKSTKDTKTKDCQVRITIDVRKFGLYSVINKFVLYVSTNSSTGCWCTIDGSRGKAPDTFITFANKVKVEGWSGWNVINISPISLWNGRTDFADMYGIIRFTFGCTGFVDPNTVYTGLNVQRILAFGGMGWTTPSTMAKTGHLYEYDADQNATFPASVKAKSFDGNATSATKATQDGDGNVIATTYSTKVSVGDTSTDFVKIFENELAS